MEKPVTVDGPSTRKLLKLAEQSEKRNLKVGVGLMCRHCLARKELFQRIKEGQIGDVITLRAYRLGSSGGFTGPKPADQSEQHADPPLLARLLRPRNHGPRRHATHKSNELAPLHVSPSTTGRSV